MQELIRAIIEAAPSWPAGLLIVAGLRTMLGSLASLLYRRLTRRQSEAQARVDARVAQGDFDQAHGNPFLQIRDEEGASGWFFVHQLLAGWAAPGFAVWVYVSVWAVAAASAPGILGQSIWWLGLGFAALEIMIVMYLIRRSSAAAPEKRRKLVHWVIVCFGFVIALVYAFAPAGVLLYTAARLVFGLVEHATWNRFQPPGSTPHPLMFF